MYKLLFKLGVMLVIMFGGMGYMFMIKTGRSPVELLNLSKLGSSSAAMQTSVARPDTLLNKESKAGSFNSKGDKTTIYKWTDEYGQVHFTNTPPLEEVDAETLIIDPNMNSIAGLKHAEPQDQAASATSSSSAGDLNINPYTPAGVKEIMDKAKNIENMMQERADQQQQALENL